MKAILFAAALVFAGLSGAHATDNFNPNPGDCITAGGAIICSTNIGYAIDPGNNAAALYVSMDGGPYSMIACLGRSGVVQTGSIPINWIQRQHDYTLKARGQPDCNPAVVNAAAFKIATGSTPGVLDAPGADSPQAGYVYRAVPDGYGGYFYWWLKSFASCGQSFGASSKLNTCWSLNFADALKLTRKGAQVARWLQSSLHVQSWGGMQPALGAGGYGNQCYIYDNSNGGLGTAYYRVAYDPGNYTGDPNTGRWDWGLPNDFTGWHYTLAEATLMDCTAATNLLYVGVDAITIVNPPTNDGVLFGSYEQ